MWELALHGGRVLEHFLVGDEAGAQAALALAKAGNLVHRVLRPEPL
jgi:hypothetical protein